MASFNIAPLLSVSAFITCAFAFVVGFLVALSKPKRPILMGALYFNGMLVLGLLTLSLRAALISEHVPASLVLPGALAALTLQTVRGWIYLYCLSQPAFLFSSCIGVALGVALFGEHTGNITSQVDDLSDARWLGLPDAALKRERLLVSDPFDRTFEHNNAYRYGMVAIDRKAQTLYFRAGTAAVESAN